MSLEIIRHINYGYDDLEPVILGLMAMNKNFMLIGRHGTGKTRLARILSRGFGESGFVFYDATKDDLITIAGIPDSDAIQRGRLEFLRHQRTIWDKTTVVVDEITRANKENQNLWLEILETRTCFGIPLSYRTIVATANPESYAAAFQLDEALLDRFSAVIPVPELQAGIKSSDVDAIVRLSSSSENVLEAEELSRIFASIQASHHRLVVGGAVAKVRQYVASVVPALLETLKEQNGPYISPRTYAKNLPESILAIGAYYAAAGSREPLQQAGLDGLTYCIGTKLQIRPVLLSAVHESAKGLLSSGEISDMDKLRLEIAALGDFQERLSFLREQGEQIQESLKSDEKEKFLGELLRGASQKGEKEKLVLLQEVLEEMGFDGDILRQVDGHLILTINSAINFILPLLSKLTIRSQGGTERAYRNIEIFRK
ncbi:MAG: AAA domain-containing protein, partial [Spirochaetales bacterium]|nr:AAA domain-containing protein [Spirochaetales bacterium]